MPRIGTLHFYPRSPCGERLPSVLHNFQPLQISIHALLAESDAADISESRGASISIHALLAESDPPFVTLFNGKAYFYPRSPCGERQHTDNGTNANLHFYPRSPCGERRDVIAVITEAQSISIHALLAESDEFRKLLHPGSTNFYPRSPCGERLRYLINAR